MTSRTLLKSRALTQGRLRELLHYDPETGVFTHRRGTGGCAAGSIAGCIDQDTGYVQIYVDYRNYTAHRLVFLYMLGRWPDPEADHENRNRTDNRWENLREATRAEQRQNSTVRKDSKTGLKGVRWIPRKQRYSATITVGGHRTILGQGFLTAELAHAAYIEAKARLHTFNPTLRGVEQAGA